MTVGTSEQLNAVTQALVDFALRVAEDKKATPAELAALPEVARVIFGQGPFT